MERTLRTCILFTPSACERPLERLEGHRVRCVCMLSLSNRQSEGIGVWGKTLGKPFCYFQSGQVRKSLVPFVLLAKPHDGSEDNILAKFRLWKPSQRALGTFGGWTWGHKGFKNYNLTRYLDP